MIKPYLMEDDNLILVDDSEIVKPSANKMEALERIRDGSTGRIENGYWTTNMIAVAPKIKHPITVYSHLYSPSNKGLSVKMKKPIKVFVMWINCSKKR